jgi:glycosyltransferase involved in cell wall biosynthesis
MTEAETFSSVTPVTPKVSVIVPHYSDLPRLSLCLDALERQTYPRALFEIVVSDNNSPEGEDAVAAVIAGRARLVVARERGAGPARNAGVRVSRAPILAFTDSDCRPEAGWLAAGLEALEACDVVGGRMVVLVEDGDRLTPAEAFERVYAFDNETYVRRKNFSVSANLFTQRTTFDAVGDFRVGVSEDIDWCHRAVAAGFELQYAQDAVVGHPARRTWAELARKWRRVNTEMFHLFTNRPGGRWKWLARSLAMPVLALAEARKAVTSRAVSRGSDRVAALVMLCRLRFWRMVQSLRLLAGAEVTN